MSETTHLERLKDIKRNIPCFGFPLITTSDQFNLFWTIYRCLEWEKSRRLVTPEMYQFCDKEVVEKILQEDNEYLSMILHESLRNVISYLNKKGKKFHLGVYLSKEPEVPQWQGFTILVNVDYKDFDEKMSLWKDIENKIAKIFDRFKTEYPESLRKIERANEIIATTVQKPPR